MQHKNPNLLKFFYDERKYKIFDDRHKDFLRKLLSKSWYSGALLVDIIFDRIKRNEWK